MTRQRTRRQDTELKWRDRGYKRRDYEVEVKRKQSVWGCTAVRERSGGDRILKAKI